MHKNKILTFIAAVVSALAIVTITSYWNFAAADNRAEAAPILAQEQDEMTLPYWDGRIGSNIAELAEAASGIDVTDLLDKKIAEADVLGPRKIEVAEEETPEAADTVDEPYDEDGSYEEPSYYSYLGSQGSYGRLYIPDAGISVSLEYANSDNAQYYTDLWDCAAAITPYSYYDTQSALIIADHYNQEFSTLSDVYPGCVAYRIYGETAYIYRCSQTGYGYNTETDLEWNDGSSCLDDDIIMYTCANGWQNIFISLWYQDGTCSVYAL